MTTSQEFESYVPVYDAIPEQWEEARPFIVEQLKKISNAVNIREIGWFLDEELLSGKAFIPVAVPAGDASPQQYRTILRKVIDFGTLPNTATKSVAHGIVFDVNFTLIQLWAAATDPVNFIALNIGHAAAAPNQIELTMDATNINITTAKNYTAFTRCFVVVEYIQEI